MLKPGHSSQLTLCAHSLGGRGGMKGGAGVAGAWASLCIRQALSLSGVAVGHRARQVKGAHHLCLALPSLSLSGTGTVSL